MRLLLTFIFIIFSSAVLAEEANLNASNNATLEKAREMIAIKQFTQSTKVLKNIVAKDPNNVDAFNLLGMCYQELGKLDKALKYYAEALKVNPEHRATNQYLGELYLKKGELSKAEERLQALDKACFFGCEEYTLLKDQIENYKKKLNKAES